MRGAPATVVAVAVVVVVGGVAVVAQCPVSATRVARSAVRVIRAEAAASRRRPDRVATRAARDPVLRAGARHRLRVVRVAAPAGTPVAMVRVSSSNPT
jgi:hypothetical protein